ncbi:MAG: response regulator transcription factor [Anaerolineales bacterium]|nr:response regulator transcription factor [Anaerolineales bacterium]
MNHPKTLLLIEDDPAVARSLQAGLEREGYRTIWKSTGTEGIQSARKHKPHLIILDVRLPDGSGFDFCQQMRRLGLSQPILILTVRGDETDKVLGLEIGADDYVTKPYSLRELHSRIRALLRRAYGELSNTGANLLFIGDLVIDTQKSQVWRGDKKISLTPTEYRLFTYLARHPGQAISRTQIVDAVWDYTADSGSEQAVTVHIRRLREKVEINPSSPTLILTVPGIGYRLVN